MAGYVRESRTTLLKRGEHPLRWFVFDAKGKTLGRFASEIAKVLRGKHHPLYTSHQDSGDGVIVINAKEIKVTGNKAAQKNYYRYSGYIGGLKEIPYREMLAKHPERIIKHAVKGMMPRKKPLGRAQLKRLRVFAGEAHHMQSQTPIQAEI